MLSQDSCNPVIRPLDEREVNSITMILRVLLNLRIFATFEEGSKALFLTLTIISKNLQEMGFLF